MRYLDLAETAGGVDAHSGLRSAPVGAYPQRPLQIVHVITRLERSGTEENTALTCTHQAASGHRVTIVHGATADPVWAERFGDDVRLIGLESIKHPIDPVADLKAVRDLTRLFRQLKPDVVHTHQSKAGIVGRVAARLARIRLVVHTVHIAPFLAVGGAKRLAYLTAERACARLSHGLIAVGQGMQEAFLAEKIGQDIAIPVIHSGMPLDRFVDAAPPADWRTRIGGWSRPGRPRFILKISAFEERKRHLPLIRAMAPGLRSQPDTCLLLAGDGPELPRCAEEARSLGIESQVRFLGHDPAPWEWIALADVCIHASEREGLPRCTVQAIAGGRPVIVARLPGIEELITDGVNGFVTDPDDLNGLARRTFALLGDRDELARLQKGARETNVSSWHEKLMGQRIDQAYQRAQKPPERPPVIDTIEFFGLPASGKTRIARELLSLLREQIAPVRTSIEVMGDDRPFTFRIGRRAALVARAFGRHPATMFRLSARLGTPGNPRDAAKTLWNFLSVLAMQLGQRPSSPLLIQDQGLAQAIWSARVNQQGGAASLRGLFGRVGGWPDRTLFVHVEAPVSLARERLSRRKRQTSRFQQPERLSDGALWAKGEAIARDIADELQQELGRRGRSAHFLSIRTDAGDPPRSQALKVRQHLERLGTPVSLAGE